MRTLVVTFALAGAFSAQGEIKPFPKVDPYTKDAPDAKTKAGYASFGPFRFGDDQTTTQIEETLGGIPLLWVETEHFKLGSGLPEYTVPDDTREKERLAGELQRLAAKLPDVKPKVKKVDPWLRLHLYAQRLEDLYAKFLVEFGLQESQFPAAPPDPKKKLPPGAYMGEGRFLGMTSKFTVLIFDKKSAHARYSSVYLGQELKGPTRWRFPTIDSWLFITANEFLEGLYANDSALACDVISGVSQNLANGYRGYRAALPLAVSEGIAHWFSRQFDPRYHIFSGLDQTKVPKEEWNWAPLVRARVEHKVFPTLETMLGWTDPEALEWADHLMLWSRTDWLLAREDGMAGKVLHGLKEPPIAGGQETSEQMTVRSREVFRKTTGSELAQLDEQWSEWVLKTYPKK